MMRNKGLLAAAILVPTVSLTAIAGTGFAMLIGNNLQPEIPSNATNVRLDLSQLDNKEINLELLEKGDSSAGTSDFTLRYKDFDDNPLFDTRANTAPIIKFSMKTDISGFEHMYDFNQGFRTRFVASSDYSGSESQDNWIKATDGKTAKDIIFADNFEDFGATTKSSFTTTNTVAAQNVHDKLISDSQPNKVVPVTALIVGDKPTVVAGNDNGRDYYTYKAFMPTNMYVSIECESNFMQYLAPVLANDEVSQAEPVDGMDRTADGISEIHLTADGKAESVLNPAVFRKYKKNATDAAVSLFAAKVSIGKGLPTTTCSTREVNDWKKQDGTAFTTADLNSLNKSSIVSLQNQYFQGGNNSITTTAAAGCYDETKPVKVEDSTASATTSQSDHDATFNKHMFGTVTNNNISFESFLSPIDFKLRDDLNETDWNQIRTLFYGKAAPLPGDQMVTTTNVPYMKITVKKVELEYKIVDWNGDENGNFEYLSTQLECKNACKAFLDSYQAAPVHSYEIYPKQAATTPIV